MIKRLLCAVLLTCAYTSAQTINPNQIRPSTTNGQAICTEGGITVWGDCGGGTGGINQLTGDVLAGPGTGSQTATLPTVNSNVGTCGDATHVGQVTLNAKGLTTACTPVSITGGGGGTPAGANGNPQINASGSFGPDVNTIVAQAADTITSIEAACAGAPCNYKSNIPQTLTLAANHTLAANVNVIFGADGQWTVNGSGFTLTIPGLVGSLSTTTHFPAGSASLTLGKLNNAVPVEWFGAVGDGATNNLATIQACINALTIGQCLIQNGVYNIAGTLTTPRSAIGLRGNVPARGGYTTGATTYPYSTLIETVAGDDAIDIHGTSGTFLDSNIFEDFAVKSSVLQTGSAAGISSSFTGGLILRNIYVQDFIRNVYLHASHSHGISGVFNVIASNTSLSGTSGSVYGFYLDSADGNAEDSLTIQNSAYAGINNGLTTYGLAAVGTDLNDWEVLNFASAVSNYGIYINRTTGSGTLIASSDMHIIDSIFDGCLTACVYVNNLSLAGQCSVAIVGGWLSPNHSVGAPALDVENSCGVNLNGAMVRGGFTTGSSVIELNGASHTAISGNTIQSTAGGKLIWLTGNSTYNSIGTNTLMGSSTVGIQFDSGSNNNTYDGQNSIDPATITTAVVDNGTNNGLHVSSVTTTGTHPFIKSGTASNSDLNGQLTLSSGTATFTFANTYTSAPICVASDTTTAANGIKVTTSTTVLTLTGTGTDVVNYICTGRN